MPPLHALRIPQSVQAAGVLALHLRGLPLLRERPAEQNEHATTHWTALARGHARSAQRFHARADSRSAPTRRCLAALTLSVASASAPCCRSWIKTSKLSEAAAHITGVFPSCGQRGAAPAHAKMSLQAARAEACPSHSTTTGLWIFLLAKQPGSATASAAASELTSDLVSTSAPRSMSTRTASELPYWAAMTRAVTSSCVRLIGETGSTPGVAPVAMRIQFRS